jgi:phage tail-like protein
MGKPFSVNTTRFSPYAAFNFLVYLGTSTSPVAGVSKVSAVKRTTAPIEYREGGNPIVLKSPGRTTYDAITMERGITFDTDFQDWADTVQKLVKGAPIRSLAQLRREVRVEMLNEIGQPVMRYFLHRCWVSEYQAMPDLDAGSTSVAIEHIKMENEGWEKDLTLTEPTET